MRELRLRHLAKREQALKRQQAEARHSLFFAHAIEEPASSVEVVQEQTRVIRLTPAMRKSR